jgi:hypothetical protein
MEPLCSLPVNGELDLPTLEESVSIDLFDPKVRPAGQVYAEDR